MNFFRSRNFSGNWNACGVATNFFRSGKFSGNWNASGTGTNFFVVKILAGIRTRAVL